MTITTSYPISQDEINSILWKVCDTFRGTVDPSEYKNYILVLLFVKYISDKYADQKNASIVVPTGGSFADIVALKGQKDIGNQVNKIITRLAEANNLKGVIDFVDFNEVCKLGKGREIKDCLSNLIAAFEAPALDLTKNSSLGVEIPGITYEHLVYKFASGSGKKGGDYYTPPEVSELLAKLVDPQPGYRIYDPACGSGSLLIRCAKRVGSNDYTLYGQEINSSTRAVAVMNMFFHNINFSRVELGDTLRNPLFLQNNQLMKFDVIVANPPFSLENWGYEEWENDRFGRNLTGLPPRRNGDFAWIQHVIASMKPDTGRAAIVIPAGVLFRGGQEGMLRQSLIESGLLDAVISLGPNLNYSTSVAINVLVLRCLKAPNRKGKILFINASTLFEADGSRNHISLRNIEQILKWYEAFEDIPGSVRVIPVNKIASTGWNLNISHYVKPEPGKLLENAIVSIRLGLDDFEDGTDERIISSIRNLYAGMLLLFKEKLLQLSPDQSEEVLIKTDMLPVKRGGKIVFMGKGKKTVELQQIRERFDNLEIKVDWNRVSEIQRKRNDIEHYYTLDKKDAIREVISNTFIVIRDFIKSELRDDPRELLGAKYWNVMLKTSELFESQRKTCLDLLMKVNWLPDSIGDTIDEIHCPSCNSSLITPTDNSIQLKVENQYFTCESCGQASSYNDLVETFLNNRSFEEMIIPSFASPN